MTPSGIEPASFLFVAQHLNHCATAVPNRNKYQEYSLGGKGGWCVGMTTLPPKCADCLQIWEPQSPGTLTACPDLYRDCFICYLRANNDYFPHTNLTDWFL